MSASTDWEAEVDALYALDPAEFVGARNALARTMKSAALKDEAAEVAKLRKPSVVAAALNRVARDDPEGIDALVGAADGVARAQQDLLDGGEAAALRAATAAQRAAARTVVAAAVEIAGAGQADAVRTTLDAAIADPDLTDRLRSGTLTDTLDAPAGFGFGFDLGPDTAAPAPPRRTKSAGRQVPGARSTGGGDVATAPGAPDDTAVAAAEAARKEARSVVAKLERELARAEKWAAKASSSVAAADQEVVTADEALAAAQQRVDDARAEQERATAEMASRQDDRDHQAALLDQARKLLDELDG